MTLENRNVIEDWRGHCDQHGRDVFWEVDCAKCAFHAQTNKPPTELDETTIFKPGCMNERVLPKKDDKGLVVQDHAGNIIMAEPVPHEVEMFRSERFIGRQKLPPSTRDWKYLCPKCGQPFSPHIFELVLDGSEPNEIHDSKLVCRKCGKLVDYITVKIIKPSIFKRLWRMIVGYKK